MKVVKNDLRKCKSKHILTQHPGKVVFLLGDCQTAQDEYHLPDKAVVVELRSWGHLGGQRSIVVRSEIRCQ